MLDINKKLYLLDEVYLQISSDSNIYIPLINIAFIQYFNKHNSSTMNQTLSFWKKFLSSNPIRTISDR